MGQKETKHGQMRVDCVRRKEQQIDRFISKQSKDDSVNTKEAHTLHEVQVTRCGTMEHKGHA
jgi:hypothetical protein